MVKRALYPALIVGMVALASLAPARGAFAAALPTIIVAAVALVLFLHGLRLSRAAMLAGATNWRLHIIVLAVTFAAFPIVGLAARALVPGLLPSALWAGVVFLCIAPSTVQSSIAFTAIARGNVAAAVCAATLSNFAGVFLTPLLAALTLGVAGVGFGADKALAIAAQVLLPAVLGQLARPWAAAWAERNAGVLKLADQGSILIIVYAAFSASVVGGLWRGVTPATLGRLALVDCAILALALWGTARLGRLGPLTREDGIAIVFCGSKKSLATGVAIAGVLFGPARAGAAILPLMLYHQVQLLACAVLARRYANDPLPATALAR